MAWFWPASSTTVAMAVATDTEPRYTRLMELAQLDHRCMYVSNLADTGRLVRF